MSNGTTGLAAQCEMLPQALGGALFWAQHDLTYAGAIDIVDGNVQDLVSFLQAQEGSGIIYAHLRATCDWLASALIDADIDAAAYHAGKSAHVRRSVQCNWVDGSLTCVVATIVSLATFQEPCCLMPRSALLCYLLPVCGCRALAWRFHLKFQI